MMLVDIGKNVWNEAEKQCCWETLSGPVSAKIRLWVIFHKLGL